MKRKIICGIYKITSPTGKIYIGQGIDCYHRWMCDYKSIERCKEQRKLYNSLKKYGWEAHSFEIILECPKQDLNAWEEYYIKKYDTFNTSHGLNLQSGGGVFEMSDETKKKMSESQKRIRLTEEAKKKLSAKRKGEDNPMYGRTGENSPRFGKKSPNRRRINQYDLDDNFIRQWDSILEATEYFGCASGVISGCLSGRRRKTSCGFKWGYAKPVTDENYQEEQQLAA